MQIVPVNPSPTKICEKAVPPCEGNLATLSPSVQPIMAAEPGPTEQQYSLRWNDFHSAILSSFRHLRDEEDFVDVTLACDGCSFSAHKVVLSACSPYFRKLLKANPCQHPIVILRDIQKKDMESLLKFMYNGEVHIGQEQLGDFLKAAQMLQVRGLADVPTPGVPMNNIDHKVSPSSTSMAWPDAPLSDSSRDRSRSRRDGHSPPPSKRTRSSDLYNAQLRNRSPDRAINNGLDLRDSLLSQALEGGPTSHLNNMKLNSENSLQTQSTGEDSSSDAAISDNESDLPPRHAPIPKQEPQDYSGEDMGMSGHNGSLLDPQRNPNFPGALLGLQGLLPGPSGMHGTPDNFVSRRSLDMLRVRATDPRPCPKCGKIYRSAHTLRTHLEDKHTICPGYRCVLCGTVAKSRNSLHSHMSRQHRGISTKDLPVLPMPSPFDPELASRLLAKAGVKISPAELRARASPTGPRRSDVKLDAKSAHSAASETSSICGDNDPEDLTITPHRFDMLPMSPPNLNHHSNTTITKVPAMKAVTAKSIDSIAQNLTGKSEDYPAALGGSAILDTYLQFMAENSFAMGVSQEQIAAMHAAKLAQLNALGTQLEQKQIGSLNKLSPPSHHFLDQMHHYSKRDMRDEEALDLGKERDKDRNINRDILEIDTERDSNEESDQNRNTRKLDISDYDKREDRMNFRIEKDDKIRGDSSEPEEDEYSEDELQKDCE
ncbi:BTB/POZ-zinc finger protein abrupt isoform X2 [Arctopsyche grandis]|uniref:BTB/POZ-zinc finger protein abrupt isoform X2 n=1 Tax=Arctopsyche grandis TaxID=121162 RepID=UPI00406DA0B4